MVWDLPVLIALASFALAAAATRVLPRRRPAGLVVLGVSAALAAAVVLLFLTA